MGFFSLLSGNSKSLGKIIDAGISGADKLVFTPEERADYDRKLQEMHLEFVRLSANESSVRSITRRLICLPIVYSWLGLVIINIAAESFGVSLKSVTDGIDQLQPVAGLAISFYLGRHIAGTYAAGKK